MTTAKNLNRAIRLILLGTLFAFAAAPPIRAEETIAYNAAESVRVPIEEFLPRELSSGNSYTMQPEAVIYRSVALFRLDTPYGVTEVVGTANLMERIAELRAIEALEAMQKSDVYKEALKNSAKGPVETAKGLVKEPVDTISDTVKGLGSFLADVGYSVISDDPSQENAAKTALGFANAKRQFAYQLEVNPYSAYEPLQARLSEVAWTAVGGGLTVTVAFSAIKDSPGKVLRAGKTANMARQIVRDNSPRRLQNINAEAMTAMGVSEALAESLLDNFNYDPEARTRLVSALQSMDKVEGRADVVARAAMATTPAQAINMRDWVELIAGYDLNVAPAKRLIIVSTAPFVVDGAGLVHGVFPTDYATWTPGLDQRLTDVSTTITAMGLKPGSVYTTAKVDPAVADFLRGLGWKEIHGNAGDLLRK